MFLADPAINKSKMFSGINSFSTAFGVLSFLSWSLYTVAVSQITNIEKAFGLSSSESGWLLTVWELGFIISCAIASYFGPRAHVPRGIGIATVICGLSGIISALPHFVAFSDSNSIVANNDNETLENNMSDASLCVNKTLTSSGIKNETNSASSTNIPMGSSKQLAYTLFNIGMILQGVGKGPCYPYSSQFIDDNVDKNKTGFYVGILSCLTVIGIAVGYGAGSLCSSIHVTLQTTHLSNSDTRFIGAWWLGYVTVGVATILSAIPMFFFPKKLKSSWSDSKQHHVQSNHSVISELKRMFSDLHSLLKSPIYLLTLIGVCILVLAFATFSGFEPKYMQTQFFIPPWQANIVIGVLSIAPYGIGSLIGGFITKKINLTPFRNILMVVCFLICVTALLVIVTFLGCENQPIYNSPADMGGMGMAYDCNATTFQPICGADKRNYFSPCHAGCVAEKANILCNCSAIPGGFATTGLCPSGCTMVWGYAAVKFVINFLDATASIPVFLIFLRASGGKNKSLAIGLSSTICAVTAWLPGPVIGGKLIDSTCIFWSSAPTTGKYCAHYDIEAQRVRMFGLIIGLQVLGILTFCLALVKARKLPDWPKEESPEYMLTPTEENQTPAKQPVSSDQ